ncbi:Gfo/Idh/MocA family oxidoreductase [Acuticoccus sp. M5D2P5]|uniref:Gfo/Idh/MocA family protein n=1 Tax=Acuticoccus kalidii TaxID=2910977 RepID=UPI001F18DF1D|nr:Gfo/Idh/MocA family oxidoreductase [Acuticoccus kalidii]MCF3936731.1 Gfo/Idh/MocA family oxidoreductase [Acuticoccus kalidii]
MPTAPLKVVTIGAGYFSRFHHEAWARMPRVDLAAVCDQDRTKAEAYAAEFGVPRVYTDPAAMIAAEKPDLVDIITPPATHKALIEMTAAAGIATVCQKAFCRSLDEAREAVKIAEDAGILLVVHENFRFSPWFVEIKRLIEDGTFGEIFGLSFRLRPGDGQGARAYLDRQPYFQTMDRFLVHETAIHFIDTFRYLLGEPASVYADLRRLNPQIAGEDAGIFILDHGNGVRALFDGNRLSDHPATNRRLTMGELFLDGSQCALWLDGYGNLFLRPFGTNEWLPHAYDWQETGFAGDAVYATEAHIVAHILDGAPLHNSAADYLTNLAVEDAIYRSSQDGVRVDLAGARSG